MKGTHSKRSNKWRAYRFLARAHPVSKAAVISKTDFLSDHFMFLEASKLTFDLFEFFSGKDS